MANYSFSGSLTTLDGRWFEGDVKVASRDALVVSPKGGSTTRVEISNVLNASFISSSDLVPDLPMAKGIVMADGSALACESLLRADTDIVRLDVTGADGRQIAVKTANVARIVLAPLPAELLKRVPPGGNPGLLLEGGDFVEGEFQGIDGGKVRISSVLFGLQSFDAGRQVIAVILRGAGEPDASFIVRLANGSVLAGKRVSFERGTTMINVDERHFGAILAPVKDVIDLRAGGERLVSLADLKPSDARASSAGRAPFAIDATTCGAPMNLLGLSARRGLGQACGTSVTFDLGDGNHYTSFVTRAGVPAALVPSGRARFLVLVDGIERYRSDSRTSVDDPLSIAVNLRGARSLTLRVDPVAADASADHAPDRAPDRAVGTTTNVTATDSPQASSSGVAGLWCEPLLFRNRPTTAP